MVECAADAVSAGKTQNDFVWDTSQAYERIRLVGVFFVAIASTHVLTDRNGLVLIVDIGTITPSVSHQLRVLVQDLLFGAELTIMVGLLGTHGLPFDAVATKFRSRDRQTTKTIEDGEWTILVHQSLLDVVGRRWVCVLWEVDGPIEIGGRRQDAR